MMTRQLQLIIAACTLVLLTGCGQYQKSQMVTNADVQGIVEKIAKKEELHSDITEAMIGEFFLEIKAGKSYPLDKCPCGCGIDKSGTAATHALAQRIMKAGDEMRRWRGQVVANAVNEKILWHMESENAKYIASYGPKGTKNQSNYGPGVLLSLFIALLLLLFVGM